MNSRDIYGDGHGFVAASQGGPPSARPDNPPGIYTVCVYDTKGVRMTGHPCDGTYDSRRLALNAIVDACSRNSRDVGHVDWYNTNQKPKPYAFNYDLTDMPSVAGHRFLGYWRYGAPDREVVHIIWRAETQSHPDYMYVTHEGAEAPHFVQSPHAWAELPKP